MKFLKTKVSSILLLALIFGALAFTIFIAPGILPDLPHSQFYPVLTNMMGIFAILSALLFLYWAYCVSREMKLRSPRRVHEARGNPGNEAYGNFIFCAECELIGGRANICQGCPKGEEGKDENPVKRAP